MPDSDKERPEPGQTGWQRLAPGAVARPLRACLHWIGKHDGHVLLAVLLVIVGISAFVAIADEVREGDTLSFDEWAVRALRRRDDPAKPVGPGWLAEVGRDLTALGGVAVLTLLMLAVAGFLWLRRMSGALAVVLVAILGGLLVNGVLKSCFERPRPDVVPHLSKVYTSSFPSGHSMLAATVYLTLGALLARFAEGRALKAYFLLVALVLTFLVGISRVYMGVHYPTDVLAGWAAGLTWALLCWLAARFLQRRGIVESTATASPSAHNGNGSHGIP